MRESSFTRPRMPSSFTDGVLSVRNQSILAAPVSYLTRWWLGYPASQAPIFLCLTLLRNNLLCPVLPRFFCTQEMPVTSAQAHLSQNRKRTSKSNSKTYYCFIRSGLSFVCNEDNKTSSELYLFPSIRYFLSVARTQYRISDHLLFHCQANLIGFAGLLGIFVSREY